MFEDDELRDPGAASPLVSAALGVDRMRRRRLAAATALVDDIVDLLHAGPALSLRVARLLAFLGRTDLTPLGYSTYSDFAAEHVEWGDTWARALIALVDSPLHEIKRAVCTGLVPITVAAEAPGTVDLDGQADWIAWVASGGRPDRWRRRGPERARILLHGHDVRLVHRARDRARLLIGRWVGDDAVDEFILRAWRARTPSRRLISQALEDPPPPDRAAVPTWPDLADPATAILGPWREPVDVHDALAQLRAVQKVTRSRGVLIGQGMRRITDEELYVDLGHASLRGLVAERMPVGIRALEKYRRLADDMSMFPELESAYEAGMDLGRITAIGRIATEDDLDRWISLARRTCLRELNRAVHLALRSTPADVLDAYEAAVAGIVESGAWRANDTVALRAAWKRAPAPRHLEVDPDLLEAARWFLETVVIPRQSGIGKVKERDDYTCQNPECHRRGIRAQAHHVIWVSHGGSDDPRNLLTVCKPCHLRLIHAGHVTVERVGETMLWSYPGRRVWVC